MLVGAGYCHRGDALHGGYLYGETDVEIITASAMVEDEAAARVLEKANFIRAARYNKKDRGLPELVIVDKWFC